MPQPGFGHLIYAVTVLARQARLSLLAKAQPKCANSVSSDVSADNAQAAIMSLDAEASDDLVLNALERIAARCGAAREEISAAHGRVWENDLLDLVARTLRFKKARIEKWSKILMAAVNRVDGDEHFPPKKGWATHGSVEGVEAGKHTGEWLFEQLDVSLLDDNYQESWLWGGDSLDYLYKDQGNLFDETVATGGTSLLDLSFENR